MKTRPHKEEMIRFATSEEGTTIWCRAKKATYWGTILDPTWDKDCIYILDDEYADLRKESADTGRPIQVYHRLHSEWATPTYELKFDADIKNYRVKPEEEGFKYPIYKRCIYKESFYSGCVVEFTSETKGVIVKDTERTREFNHNIGCRLDTWIPYTDTDVWEDCDYIEPIYYYRWERLSSKDKIVVSDLVTDKYAEKNRYKEDGWVKRTNTKRTLED